MSQSGVRVFEKWWRNVTILLLVWTFLGFSVIQGWMVGSSSLVLFDIGDRPKPQAAPTFMLGWLLFQALVLFVGNKLIYYRKTAAPWQRLPAMFGLTMPRTDLFFRRLRIALTLATVAVTVYGGGHFLRKTLNQRVLTRDGTVIADSWRDHFLEFVSPWDAFSSKRYHLDSADGVTFFPFWQPWFFTILYVSVLVGWVYVLRRNAR